MRSCGWTCCCLIAFLLAAFPVISSCLLLDFLAILVYVFLRLFVVALPQLPHQPLVMWFHLLYKFKGMLML